MLDENGIKEKITKNAEAIKNLFYLRDECRNEMFHRIEEGENRMSELKAEFKNDIKRFEKKIDWLYIFLIMNLGGVLVNLLMYLAKKGG